MRLTKVMQDTHSTLDDTLEVVLVRTTHPGNIGAAARAMKTMGLHRLTLVEPNGFPSAEATSRASGADDVLAAARVCQTLDEALGSATLVMGTSARLRSIPMPQLDPRQAIARAQQELSDGGRVALLFGQERSGLTNEEIGRCHALINIPSNPDYSSLNLGSAVQVICYEWAMCGAGKARPAVPRSEHEDPRATADMLEGFYQHLEQTLLAIDYLDPKQPVALMQRLRRLYSRARPSKTEIDILRGILAKTLKSASTRRTGSPAP